MRGALPEILNHLLRVVTFACVDEKIRLQQDLMVGSVNVCVGVVMGDQPRDALHIAARDGQVRKEGLRQRRALQFLMLAVRVAVFFPAERAGDVVDERGQLQHGLGMTVQPFQLADRSGQRPNLEEVVDVVERAAGARDHLLCCGCNEHIRSLHQSAVPVFGTKKRVVSTPSSASSCTFRARPPP